MKLVVLVMLACTVVGGCGKKKKAEDKAPPASVEPATGSAAPAPAPPAPGSGTIDLPKPDPKAATPADDGGELEQKTRSIDGDKKPTPADDGGEVKQP